MTTRKTFIATVEAAPRDEAPAYVATEPAFSFKVYEGEDGGEQQETTFYFDIADPDDPIPVKLGDGTFGSVFRVMRNNIPYALKVFYETSSETTRRRYREEMNAAAAIRAGLEKRMDATTDGLDAQIVLPIGRTGQFTASRAYHELQRYFTSSNYSISDYAIVMPLYSCTLKDLLERGAPARRLVKAVIKPEQGIAGYEILRKLDYAHREGIILPLISQIAIGLHALHAANYHHHDLKPANILIKPRGFQLDVHIGDLGFLNPNVEGGATRHGESQALGTRHYRSPEQKDHFDVCEVDVEEITKPMGTTSLITRDRKFVDTLIETGDTLAFSKDPAHTLYTIHELTPNVADGTTRIKLNKDYGIGPEKRTQVILYKRHTVRTDVFGLGALLFDLLTGGSSPERFYDMIRAWDRDDAGPIRAHIDKFISIRTGSTTSPEESARFVQLRHNGRYPSDKIVSILLKCMLSAVPDSYVNMADSLESLDIFKNIIDDLSEAMRGNDPDMQNQSNPLWDGAELAFRMEAPTGDFLNNLYRIQSLGPDDLAKRITLGYVLLRQVHETVKRNVNSDAVFFADISPANLGEAANSGRRYESQTEYFGQISEGDAFGIPSSPHDPYVPPMLIFRSRPANLLPVYDSGDHHDDGHFIVRYKDSCPLWQGIEVGDLLLIETEEPRRSRVTARLVEVLPGSIDVKIEPLFGDKAPLPKPGPSGLEAVVIKNLSPVEYYLSMVGIYVHHLFFVDGAHGSGLPDIIYEFLQKKYTNKLDGVESRFTQSTPPVPDSRARGANEIDRIFQYLAEFYAWLVCRDYKQLPTPDYNTLMEQELLAKLDGPIGILRDLISNVVAFTEEQGNQQRQVLLSTQPKLIDLMTVDHIEDYDWTLTVDEPEYVATLEEFLDEIYTGRPRNRKSSRKLPFRNINVKAAGKAASKGTRGLGRKLRRPRPPRIT